MILNLGFVGENEHRKFNFDCMKMFGEYPSASVSLTVQPPAGDCYPAVIERNGDLVSWTVTDSDLIEEGCGEIQLAFMVGDVKAKTCIGRTKVERSLGTPGQIPTPIENWIEQAEEIISEAEDAAEAAKNAAEHQPIIDDNGYWNTWDAEAEEYVSTGVKAQGEDGEPGQDGTDATPALITVDYSELTFPVAEGKLCYHSGLLYKANQAIATSEAWTAAHWTQTTIEAEQHALLTQINSCDDEIKNIQTYESEEGNPIVLTDCAKNGRMKNVKVAVLYSQSGSGTPAPSNQRAITGATQAQVYVSNEDTSDPTEHEEEWSGAVFGGYIDFADGKVVATHMVLEKTVANMNNSNSYPGWTGCTELDLIEGVTSGTSGDITAVAGNVGTKFSYNTKNSNKIIFLSTGYYENLTQDQWKATYPNLTVQFVLPLKEEIVVATFTPHSIPCFDTETHIWCDNSEPIRVVYPINTTTVYEKIKDDTDINNLLKDCLEDTTTSVSKDSTGRVVGITYTKDGVTVRTDAITYGSGSIVETRTGFGKTVTITTNLSTLSTEVEVV